MRLLAETYCSLQLAYFTIVTILLLVLRDLIDSIFAANGSVICKVML